MTDSYGSPALPPSRVRVTVRVRVRVTIGVTVGVAVRVRVTVGGLIRTASSISETQTAEENGVYDSGVRFRVRRKVRR